VDLYSAFIVVPHSQGASSQSEFRKGLWYCEN